MLESQAHFAEAKATVAKAKSRPEVIKAQTEIKQAEELDLPDAGIAGISRQSSRSKSSTYQSSQRREVLEAENQLKRAKTAVEVAQSRIRSADAAYQARLATIRNCC